VRVSQLLLLLVFLPGAVLGADYFGAIAWSPQSKVYGWANDFSSRAAAEKAAVTHCAKRAKDCQAVLWFKSACGALAVGPKGDAGWAWAENQPQADRSALQACAKHSKACTVKQRLCTGDKRAATPR